jgi:restriction endonuclease S subunit
MGMIIKKLSLKSLSINERIGLKDYSLLQLKNFVYVKNILVDNDAVNGIKSGRTPSKFNEQYWYGEYEFLTMQDVDKSVYILNSECLEKITDYAIEEEKTLYRATKGDLIFSNAMTVGLAFEIDRDVYLNQNIFALKIDSSKYSKTFLKWYFNLIFKPNFNKVHTSKYISKEEVAKIRIPKIAIKNLKLLELQIQPIETEITNLKNSKLKPLDIINRVFGEEFGFDWEEFEKQKKQKTYSSNLNEFANNIDCRMGLKFHNLAGKYLHSFLVSNTTKKVKDYIEEPILLGKSVSPSDYDEEGEYFYIAMSNIKTYAFDPEDCKKVTEEYSNSNLKKTVQKGDILLARSGEGTIGKVALIEDEDLYAIFADFTQRIRLTNYNTLFAYYFFRSEFFQYLVYTHKKGLGNNTNIFPSQIQEFPIPDWDDTKQTEIVEKIKSQIDAQNSIDRQIEEKQQQITEIIENAIKTE